MPKKDYFQAIELVNEEPIRQDDGRLLIGTMSTTVDGITKTMPLLYSRLNNGDNIAWGGNKKSCKLSSYLGQEGTNATKIALRFPGWSPSNDICANKGLLQKTIASKAFQYLESWESDESEHTSKTEDGREAAIDDMKAEPINEMQRQHKAVDTVFENLPMLKDKWSDQDPMPRLFFAALEYQNPGVDITTLPTYQLIQKGILEKKRATQGYTIHSSSSSTDEPENADDVEPLKGKNVRQPSVETRHGSAFQSDVEMGTVSEQPKSRASLGYQELVEVEANTEPGQQPGKPEASIINQSVEPPIHASGIRRSTSINSSVGDSEVEAAIKTIKELSSGRSGY